MDDRQRLRYSRHLLLNEFGEEAQERLLASHALVVGAGGLGSPALLYLASSGVGRITVCDGDRVDLTNLQRQVVHRVDSDRQPKAASAAATLAAHQSRDPGRGAGRARRRPSGSRRWCARADVVLDCSDNFATRHAINRACVAARRAAGVGRGHPLRRPGRGIRPAARGCALLPLPLRRGRARREEERCATMGVFAPAGRHHRHVPGDGGDQAAGGHRRIARRAAAAVRRARQPLARSAARARSPLPRVRRGARAAA